MVTISKIKKVYHFVQKKGSQIILKKFCCERRVLEAKISQISCHICRNKEEGSMLLNKRLPISGIRLAMEYHGVLNEWGKRLQAHFQARKRVGWGEKLEKKIGGNKKEKKKRQKKREKKREKKKRKKIEMKINKQISEQK